MQQVHLQEAYSPMPKGHTEYNLPVLLRFLRHIHGIPGGCLVEPAEVEQKVLRQATESREQCSGPPSPVIGSSAQQHRSQLLDDCVETSRGSDRRRLGPGSADSKAGAGRVASNRPRRRTARGILAPYSGYTAGCTERCLWPPCFACRETSLLGFCAHSRGSNFA